MAAKTKTVKGSVDVLLSPQLRHSTAWSRSVQKAIGGYMAEHFITVDKRALERTLRGLLAVARIRFTAAAFRRSSRVQRAIKMLADYGLKDLQ